MDKTIEQVKEDICEVGRRIWARQYCAGNEGNHSVRISDDRYLVTPTGISKGFLSPEDICLVNEHGQLIEQNPNNRHPSSEIKVHMAIYQKRTDVNAVVHSHPPHATAFAISGIPLPEGVHPEAEVFLGKVPTAPYAAPSTQQLPESIVPLVTENNNTILMGNHGSVTFSHELIDAYYKLEILDAYCRILLLTKQVGNINFLTEQQIKQLLEIKAQFGMADDRSLNSTQQFGQGNQHFMSTFAGPTPSQSGFSPELVQSLAKAVAKEIRKDIAQD